MTIEAINDTIGDILKLDGLQSPGNLEECIKLCKQGFHK